MPRPRAIALIVLTRKTVLSHADERLPADAKRLRDDAASLAQLLLDVRAGRINAFELTFPSPMHVTVCAD
ncbi:MAG TPA: hypothetical protein VL689_05585 [Paraburkholderia sp.]|nr:hypothetical protein [Paraburkholderia sp.]